ncbi:MAG: crossover junction endodeoxyribonuclease RusA [Candidatus Tokpelaia sp. JSC189]|nr:MAG: crossover junction endodeoxyribonuclease RusA [Candidatus Tokpelaia sp. JSC189]
MLKLDLPFPPSVNGLYRNGGMKKGRHRTARYKAWVREASLCVGEVHRKAMSAYSLLIVLKRPDRRMRDLGNYEKAISDLLVSHGVVRDDSDCCSLMMKWHDAMDGAGMVSSPTGASCVVSECLVIVQQEPTDRSSLS